jgi:hypothetical protein
VGRGSLNSDRQAAKPPEPRDHGERQDSTSLRDDTEWLIKAGAASLSEEPFTSFGLMSHFGRILMEMPVVTACEAEACAYNTDRTCHALAITVGDVRHAYCDTFFKAPAKGGDPIAVGHVGACKMSDCQHNVQFECQAPGITVGYAENAADCLTYAPA